MKRRLNSLLLVLAMILSLLPIQAFAADTAKPVDTANPFEDVGQGSWYYDAVQYVRVNELFNGVSETLFWPEGTMTRAMFVTVLGRMAGVNPESYSGASGFADVPENTYYAPYVAWAHRYGIAQGTWENEASGEKGFSPDALLSRQQMAVFFVRYFELFDVDYETGANVDTVPADIDSVSPWARDAVMKMWQTGLLAGSDGSFMPHGSATRAQAATICARADEAVSVWYSEPGVPSERVRIDPATGLPYGDDTQQPEPSPPPAPGDSGNSGTTSGGSYTVTFYDGSKTIERFTVKKGEPLGQLPSAAKSSKAGYILEGYYTDSDFKTPFYAGNPVTGNMSVYAKYESMGEAEALTVDSFARMDQQPDVTFSFKPLAGTADTLSAAQAAVTLLVKDGSDPVKIEVTGSGTYTVRAPAGFNKGCSYELNLAEGWTFVPDGSDNIPSNAIRTAAFSIEMEEVEKLSMSEGIRYIKDTDQINYTYKNTNGTSYTVPELPSNADITGGGSFNYDNTSGWQNGDILCIYVGGKPDSDETEKTEEAIYAKVSSVSGNTVNFVPLAQEDQMKLYEIPDNFPIKVTELPDGTTGTVSISDLDTALYAQMVGAGEASDVNAAKARLNAGDFVTLYVNADSISAESDLYFGEVTDVGADGVITYEKSSAEAIRESANLYKSVDIDSSDIITPEEQAEIQRIVQAQVERSDFATEAAYTLADMATRTEGFRNSAGVLNLTATGEDGEPLSYAELTKYADVMTLADDDDEDKKPEVKVSVITDPSKLHFGSKGVQLAVNVSAEFEANGKDDGKIKFELSATFVQEVAVDPKVKGELTYYELLGFIPVPNGVQVNAIIDVKSYTAMSLRADIYTVAPEDKSVWESFKDFLKDPSDLDDIPGLSDEIKQGIKTVGDALNEIEEIKAKLDKGLEDADKLNSDLNALWGAVEKVAQDGLTRETYEAACENLSKTNVAGELMEMLHISDEEISADYYHGLGELMDAYSEMLERETDWVQLVDAQMFDTHTPPEYGVMVGIQGSFVVRADVNIALGTNLEYEVGKRYNFWFRVGLYSPSSGSSTMDLIDEHFAFQFYVMGKLGLKVGVRLKAYAAIGSLDAVSVGLTTELGPYIKLWGFFIYDYSKYRPKNANTFTSKQQMAGALYLEFGLYLMVGIEAKALFLEYDKDFVDEEFPLLEAGDKIYYYDTAYKPLDDADEIVVYNNGTAVQQEGCAVSMLLPEDTYALNYIDLTTGRQGTKSLNFDNYTFKVSNPNFRVDNVNGKPVVSVISIPQNVRLMQCDLTITYKHGKLAFSTFDMSATVHLAWTNMTAAEYQQVYTASVVVPDGSNGYDVVWSQRVRKGTPFDLPTEDEIKALLSWSDAKYVKTTGYGSQATKDITLIQDTQYSYEFGYQTYQLTVTGIEDGNGSRTFTGKYGEPFDFSYLLDTGTDGPKKYTSFAGLMMDGQPLSLNQPVTGKFATSEKATAVAQYADETVTATFRFTGIEHEDITVNLRKGGTPDTGAVEKAVNDAAAVSGGKVITGYYPAIGPLDGDVTYQVVCGIPAGRKTTVSFEANGGEAVEPVQRVIGGVLGELPATTKDGGWALEGWYTDAGLTEKATASTPVTENMILYAKWIEDKAVTVTLNVNGGTNLPEADRTRSVIPGRTYGDELPTPERSGYFFLGWFTQQEGGEQVTAETTVTETANHTLYAHWRKLKTIPASVFSFTNTTVTYNNTAHAAAYTFNPSSLTDCPEESSFTISYTRESDEFISTPTTAGTSGLKADGSGVPITAGTYNVHITRNADDTYDKFDQNYTGVLVINRATRDLSGITNSDITVTGSGEHLTYVNASLDRSKIPDLDEDVYFAYYVRSEGGSTIKGYVKTQTFQVEGVEVRPVESGLLYDLTPGISYIIEKVGIIGDVNYEDAWKDSLNVGFSTKKPPLKEATDKDDWSYFADTSWYFDNQEASEYIITTAAQLAGLASGTICTQLTGKTVKLGADIDLSAHRWVPIGSKSDSSSPFAFHIPFTGTFDGCGHTISGICVEVRSGTVNYMPTGFFGYAQNATIKNVKLVDSMVEGVFDGALLRTAGPDVTIQNCESNISVPDGRWSYPSNLMYRFIMSSDVTIIDCVCRPFPTKTWS